MSVFVLTLSCVLIEHNTVYVRVSKYFENVCYVVYKIKILHEFFLNFKVSFINADSREQCSLQSNEYPSTFKH